MLVVESQLNVLLGKDSLSVFNFALPASSSPGLNEHPIVLISHCKTTFIF